MTSLNRGHGMLGEFGHSPRGPSAFRGIPTTASVYRGRTMVVNGVQARFQAFRGGGARTAALPLSIWRPFTVDSQRRLSRSVSLFRFERQLRSALETSRATGGPGAARKAGHSPGGIGPAGPGAQTPSKLKQNFFYLLRIFC